MRRRPIFSYENRLLVLLGVSFGFAFFDRNSASVLIPYMAKDLRLSNTQSALINPVLSVMWALGACVIARWSDTKGSRKPFLLAFLLIFSACSILSGLAQSFPLLLAARAVMGAVEGPFLLIMGWTFLPKFLTEVRGMPGPAMGSLLSVLGFASAISGFGAPWLSDRIGRKPVMIGFCLLGALTSGRHVLQWSHRGSAVLMMAAAGAIGCVLCFFLVETAPVKTRAVNP